MLYGHPESIEDSFIETVASHPNLCPYFDIPIQHVSPGILKRMGRRYTRDDLYRLFDRIRTQVPDAVLRTTIIVGFPGESDKDFDQLLKFAEDVQFDHLGVFIYSDSDDLASHKLSGHVPTEVACDRYHQLMSAQSGISSENNQKYIGKTLKVLVEESLDNHLFAGRTNFQAPEVDGISYINTEQSPFKLKIGSFVDMRVTDAMEYDLMGVADMNDLKQKILAAVKNDLDDIEKALADNLNPLSGSGLRSGRSHSIQRRQAAAPFANGSLSPDLRL